LHVGCIPSKALLHAAKVITDARDAAHLGITFGEPKIDLDAIRNIASASRRNCRATSSNSARRARWITSLAAARLLTGQTIEVEGGKHYRFQQCIVATGSSPARPGPLGLNSPRVMDSTGALKLEDVPKSCSSSAAATSAWRWATSTAALGSR